MAFNKIVIKSRETRGQRLARQLRDFAGNRPMTVLGAVLGTGLVVGLGAGTAAGMVNNSRLQAKVESQQAELAQVQSASQAQINALAARLGELQAQATRLNALGERLTQMGKLQDGEFDFNEPVGVGGGDEPAQDMPACRPETPLLRRAGSGRAAAACPASS